MFYISYIDKDESEFSDAELILKYKHKWLEKYKQYSKVIPNLMKK